MNGASVGSQERIAIRHGAFISAEADTSAESESGFLNVENFRLGEVEHIVGVKVFFEAVSIIVNEEILAFAVLLITSS